MGDGHQYAGQETHTEEDGHLEPEHHGEVGRHVADVEKSLQVGLEDPRNAECKAQEKHGYAHGPEAPVPEFGFVFTDILELEHSVVEDDQVKKRVSPEESQVPVGHRDLAPVGIVVDGGEGVDEPEHAGSQEVVNRHAHDVGPE